MDEFESFMQSYSEAVAALAYAARNFLKDILPDSIEIVDAPSKIIAYGFSPKYADLICAIAPYKTYINIIFSRGAEMSDPDVLLSGTGKKARHIKISTVEDLSRPGVRALVETAAQIVRSTTKAK